MLLIHLRMFPAKGVSTFALGFDKGNKEETKLVAELVAGALCLILKSAPAVFHLLSHVYAEFQQLGLTSSSTQSPISVF